MYPTCVSVKSIGAKYRKTKGTAKDSKKFEDRIGGKKKITSSTSEGSAEGEPEGVCSDINSSALSKYHLLHLCWCFVYKRRTLLFC